MKTSQRPISANGEAGSTSSLEDFRASLSVMPGSEEARMMTATSGRTCSAVSTKCSPIGSWLRMLLASSRWSSRARFLQWRVRELYSTRATEYEDTDLSKPLPCNASATTLRVTDTKSSRCLFQLVPLEPLTEETASSSLDGVLLPTPRSCRFMGASLETDAIVADNSNPNLEVVIARKLREGLFPTPKANVVNGCDLNNPTLAERNKSNLEEEVAKMVVSQGVDAGQTFRLSPLFTEEMMGFPFLWTTLPFLRQSGAPSPSRPTATP